GEPRVNENVVRDFVGGGDVLERKRAPHERRRIGTPRDVAQAVTVSQLPTVQEESRSDPATVLLRDRKLERQESDFTHLPSPWSVAVIQQFIGFRQAPEIAV